MKSFRCNDLVSLSQPRSAIVMGCVIVHCSDDAKSPINVRTVMIQGAADLCDLPIASEGQEKHFLRGYQRVLLDGVGHFPHREAPIAVFDAVLPLLS